MRYDIYATFLILNFFSRAKCNSTQLPEWLVNLNKTLLKYGWPTCICVDEHTCTAPLLPTWEHQLGEIHPLPELACLSTTKIPLDSKAFSSGIRYAALHLLDAQQKSFADAMETLFDGESLPWHDKDFEFLNQIETSLKERGRSAEWIECQASGYMLGWVLLVQSQLWLRLCRMTSIDTGGLLLLKEAKGMLDLIAEILELSTKLKLWAQLTEGEKISFPFTSAILRGGHFWVVQQVLYLKHDYRLLCHNGWNHARIRFESEVLPWQVGWHQSSLDAVQYIMRFVDL